MYDFPSAIFKHSLEIMLIEIYSRVLEQAREHYRRVTPKTSEERNDCLIS